MQTKFYIKQNTIEKIFLYLYFIILFFPLFLGFYNNGIRFDLVGKFDVNFNTIKYYVLPVNFVLSFFLFFFLKIRISLKKLILNLFLVLWIYIYNIYNDISHNNFLKTFILSFIILNYPIIFDRLLEQFKDKKKFIHIFKLIFIALVLILLINWTLFDKTYLFGKNFKIYSFYDYYPITFTILYLIFFNFYKKFISFENIFFIILLLIISYLTQSRTVLLSNIIFIILLIITKTFLKFNKNRKIIKTNNKFFLFYKINIFFYFYLILIFSFFYVYVNLFDFISHYSFFLTVKYRFAELFNFIEILNIKNFFLPFISEYDNYKFLPSESFHNQFIEIYYHMGFFSIIIVISLHDLLKNVHKNNLINLYLLFIFFIPILFIMTPFTHIYTCTVFIFSLCFLKFNYKRIN